MHTQDLLSLRSRLYTVSSVCDFWVECSVRRIYIVNKFNTSSFSALSAGGATSQAKKTNPSVRFQRITSALHFLNQEPHQLLCKQLHVDMADSNSECSFPVFNIFWLEAKFVCSTIDPVFSSHSDVNPACHQAQKPCVGAFFRYLLPGRSSDPCYLQTPVGCQRVRGEIFLYLEKLQTASHH